jgi:hypothetical protein
MLNDISNDLVADLTITPQCDGVRTSINDRCYEKESTIDACDLSCDCQIKTSVACLSDKTIQGIIQRFLLEKKTPKEKLAKSLGIKTADLEKLLLKKGTLKLVAKINLPLIKLYCRTQWVRKDEK